MSFSNLTIVSVTGSDDYAEGSAWAIIRSCEQLPGSKGLLICPTCPANFPPIGNFQYQSCLPFGYLEYSIFMLYNLAQYIETDYCLVVQNDGWVLNGKNWRDEFWDYDYIGAPVVGDYRVEKNKFGQPYIIAQPASEPYKTLEKFPQNGGFSLRSKRLLDMPRQLDLSMTINPTLIADLSRPFEMKWDNNPIHNEDLFLTVQMRPILEQAGIKFAPFDVANHFSFDSALAPLFGKVPYIEILGHHFFRKTVLEDYDKVATQFPKKYFPNNEIPANIRKLFSTFMKQKYHIKIDLI